MTKKYTDAEVMAMINKVDTLTIKEQAVQLIEILKEIENDKGINKDEEGFISTPVDVKYPTVATLCDRVLIGKHGSNNYWGHKQVENEGWRIGPGEQDSHGWLTGVIYLKKGKYVYG